MLPFFFFFFKWLILIISLPTASNLICPDVPAAIARLNTVP